MSLVLDLVDSARWLDHSTQWPTWLNSSWILRHDARLICELSHPDDCDAIRAIVPHPERLIAYPDYSTLKTTLGKDDLELVHQAFLQCLGAATYAKLTPAMAELSFHVKNPALAERSQQVKTVDRLALVSPMPPTPSGVANYCAEILPALAEKYTVTLVVDKPENVEASLAKQFDVMSHAQFIKLGGSFDRVMYHFGNSSFHYDYFTLLKVHPGIVILHDIYLGDCIFSNFKRLGLVELLQRVYASHGWSALRDCQGSVKQTIGLYPACGSLFSDSYGVLVHSQFAKDNLSLFFDESTLSNLCVTPLARQIKQLPESSDARQRLDIPKEAKVYASFGLFNLNKCLNELLEAWAQSTLASDPAALLFLVGGCDDRELQKRLKKSISKMPIPDQFRLTGFIDNSTYDDYLSAADFSIQLRQNSRGESSAALLDGMAAGLTTVVNAHGSMAEIPDNTVMKLPDEFSIEDLVNALDATNTSQQLGKISKTYVAEHHSPMKVASAYLEHMESCYKNQTKRLVDILQSSLFTPRLEELAPETLFDCIEELNDLMSCASAGTSALSGRQLLVDISAVVQHDLKSGIQRVVRNILRELLQNEYLGFRVEAVYYDFESGRFRYARTFVNSFLKLSPLSLADDVVEARPGDIFLGLDLDYRIAGESQSRQWLQFWRGRGVKIHYVLYDLMPIALPHCFPSDQLPLYRNWLSAITTLSDGVVAISRAVMDDYCRWMDDEGCGQDSRPDVSYFHLGAEMETQNEAAILDRAEKRVLDKLSDQTYLLMVGTIEPRKGHAQVLDAFEDMWSQEVEINLVIVGSVGWADHKLVKRLKKLSAESTRVYWLDYVSDPMLSSLYEGCAGTLMASLGEGFGLPLIEAAHYGASLLARDLPVFREVCGDHAWYFQARNGAELAAELQEWLELCHSSSEPKSLGVEWKTWTQSTAQLVDSIIHN